jgi:hypothetical protein
MMKLKEKTLQKSQGQKLKTKRTWTKSKNKINRGATLKI